MYFNTFYTNIIQSFLILNFINIVMEKKDRLAKAIAYLKMQGIVDSQVDAARKMNAAESTMSSAIGGNERYLNNRFLKRFNEAFNNIFSFDWLANGIGTMLNNCGCSSADDESIYHPSSDGTRSEGEAKEEGTHNGGTTEELRKENTMLKELLAEKERTIQILLKNKQ